MTEIVN